MRRALAMALLCVPLAAADDKPPEGFQPLFNGKDLAGWTVNKGGRIDRWGAEDGVIYTKGGGGKGLKPTQKTGSIYGVVPPSKDALKPVGEWNSYRIICKGRQVTIILNGTTIVDANLDDHKEHFKAHPGLTREKGHLGLQSHDGRVEFRNLYVKPL
jgi:hypothetical protein